jgi:mannose/fructose/N-acetylgalactosamine-specific phosphotransferase system component IID
VTDLPPIGDPDIFIVLMTVLLALGASGLCAGWARGQVSRLGVLCTLAAVCGFGWVGLQEGFALGTVPSAFVEVLARAVR